MIELMRDLGHERFDVVGHDRGARVAYRMALDHPDVVSSLTVIDIIPTLDEWELVTGRSSLDIFHWPFLAQPATITEPLLSSAPDVWVDHLLDSWSVRPEALTEEVRAEYRRCFDRPDVIAGTCADYRAGAGVDVDHDRRDRSEGRLIDCEVLVLRQPPSRRSDSVLAAVDAVGQLGRSRWRSLPPRGGPRRGARRARAVPSSASGRLRFDRRGCADRGLRLIGLRGE